MAFVPREAISGAAIAALGCDEILMRPDALIGDAGPIIQGEDSLFRHAPEKIRDYLVQRMRALPGKGRPPAVAESMANLECEVSRYATARAARRRSCLTRNWPTLHQTNGKRGAGRRVGRGEISHGSRPSRG